MTWVAAAVVGGAVIGGVVSSKNAKKAGKAQTNASGDAIGFERESRDLALGLQKPYRDASYAATAALMDLTGLQRPAARKPLGFDEWYAQQPAESVAPAQKKKKHGLFGGGVLGGLLAPSPKDFLRGQVDPAGAIKSAVSGSSGGSVSPDLQAKYQSYVDEFNDTPDLGSYAHYDFKTDPGYDFRLGEGSKALEHSLVARSGALSGAAGKSALRYAQGYASEEYKNVYNRIAGIAGFGQTATNSSTGAVLQTGSNISSALLNAGDARASSYIAQGNSWSNAINQASMAGGYYLGQPG